MSRILLCLSLLGLSAAHSMECGELVTLAEVQPVCDIKELTYKKHFMETGKNEQTCVRVFHKDLGKEVFLNVAHYKNPNRTNSYFNSVTHRKDAKSIKVGEQSGLYSKYSKVMNRHVVYFKKGNNIVELRSIFSPKKTPVCSSEQLTVLAKSVEKRMP